MSGTQEQVTFADVLRPDLKSYCKASNLAFNERIKILIAEGKNIYHFGFGQAPFPPIPEMVEALKEHAAEKAYLPVAGLPELRQAIVDFHARFDGYTDLKAEDVVVGPGTKQMIFLCLNVFHGSVMLCSPTWTTYHPQAVLAHHSPYIVNSSMELGWRITAEEIEKCITTNNITGNKVLILCNPDNPTGVTYSSEESMEIAKCCRKHGIIVISDEIYSRLHYEGSHVSLVRHYPEGTIISTGMSKWPSAGGWRIGYLIFPPPLRQLREAVISASSHTHSCAPAPQQYAVAQTLVRFDVCDSYMKHTTRIMKAIGEFCYRELTSVGVKAVPPNGAYYFFPDFDCLREQLHRRGVRSGDQMCQRMLEEADVALMAGGPAFLRPDDEFTVRLCYVNFDGAHALEESRRLGMESGLSEDFIARFCSPVYMGILALKKWVLKVKTE